MPFLLIITSQLIGEAGAVKRIIIIFGKFIFFCFFSSDMASAVVTHTSHD